MPTGYTAAVADGTVTDLETFALQLARGMGALVTMRDEPFDAPIPDRFEPSTYNADRLVELKRERARVMALTEVGCQNEVDKLTQEYKIGRAKAEQKHKDIRLRYEAMIEKVEAWEGAPEGIKSYALQQLDDSMNFDCREPFKYYRPKPETDPVEWKLYKLQDLEKDIIYNAEQHAAEVERTESRNLWIKQLKESLK